MVLIAEQLVRVAIDVARLSPNIAYGRYLSWPTGISNTEPTGPSMTDTGELRWRDRRHHAPGNYDTTGMKYVSYFVLALLIGAAAIYGIRNGVSLPLG